MAAMVTRGWREMLRGILAGDSVNFGAMNMPRLLTGDAAPQLCATYFLSTVNGRRLSATVESTGNLLVAVDTQIFVYLSRIPHQRQRLGSMPALNFKKKTARLVRFVLFVAEAAD